MAQVTLREAKAADARAIAEIHVAAWRAAYRGIMPDAYLASLDVEERADVWARRITRGGPYKIALAELGGRAIGFCSFGPTRDAQPPEVAEIYAINLHPDHWRRGVGRALCERACREAALREHSVMTLWVLKENAPARRFYESLGYAPDGAERRNDKLTGTPCDEVRYRRRL